MLTFEQIKELIELVAARGLGGLEIERAGFRFEIQGQGQTATVVQAPTVTPAVTAVAPAPAPAAPAPAESAAEDEPPAGHQLTSPIVGTFYAAPSPDASPFAQKGDTVRKGQVLCIVEAMKLMNEIESDVDGEILEILPQNGQPVEFGEPLFVIKTA